MSTDRRELSFAFDINIIPYNDRWFFFLLIITVIFITVYIVSYNVGVLNAYRKNV
jgi:hypothetical protein